MRRRALLIGGLIVLIAALVGLLGYTGRLGSNLREVSPGKLYRSGDMSAAALRKVVGQHKIRSVVNLRSAPNWDRYNAQVAGCREAGVLHEHIPMPSSELPEAAIVIRLVERFEDGPYPMLVHCNAGADRSGLAAALYLALVEKTPLPEAEAAQLTWRYGHVSGVQERFFRLYRDTAKGRDLRTWIFEVYPEIREGNRP